MISEIDKPCYKCNMRGVEIAYFLDADKRVEIEWHCTMCQAYHIFKTYHFLGDEEE